MKLHLPLSLLRALPVALMTTAMAAETIIINNMKPAMAEGDSYNTHYYQATDCNLQLNGNWCPGTFTDEYGDWTYMQFNWESYYGSSAQNYTLSGNGILGPLHSSWYDDNFFFNIVGVGKYTIETGVTLKEVALQVSGSSSWDDEALNLEVDINGSVTGLAPALMVNNAILDLRDATISGSIIQYGISGDAVIRMKNLSITPTTKLIVEGNLGSLGNGARIEGDLTLSGTSFNIQKETTFTEWNDPQYEKQGYILVNGDNPTLTVSGAITISRATTILYFSGAIDYDENGNWVEGAGEVDPTIPLFICNEINEENLHLLEPYAAKEIYDYEADEGYTWYKPLKNENCYYYAVTGNDNLVYVYLGDGSITAGPDENDIVVGEGQDVELGGQNMPSSEKLVWLNGGTADASGLADELLSNEIILGKEGGTLLTAETQTMSLVGKGSVNYSIEAATGSQAAAKLEIGKAGSSDVLKLNGDKYESAVVNVNSGTVVIGGDTTVGLGTGSTEMILAADTKLSNEGTVAADITSKVGSTVTNLDSIKGNVSLEEGAVLNNNTGSSITGDVTAKGKVTNYGIITGTITSTAELVNNGTIAGTLNAEGSVSGSGTFADTILASTASLHVGNSPGYQYHETLTINRGATLSFSIDGATPANVNENGSGTHSALKVGTLTIEPANGTETVTVKVDVTMGILAAGTELPALTLISFDNSNADEDDFTLDLQDKSGLLEEGSTITFEDGELKFNATVSKAALAALMDSNSANVANTMWASANAVHEFARTAENQFLIGMPGQTTFWGAGIGSFMNVGGDQGFTSNAGGYAVGLQHAFTEKFRAGVAFGQMFGDFQSDDKQLKVDQKALMPAFTAQYVTKTGKISSVTVNGHVAYGMVENEAETYQAGTSGKADWDDEVLNIGARVAWNVQLGRVTASLFTGLEYQSVDQDSFTETFTGGEREYRNGSMSSLSVPFGLTLTGIYEMEGTNVLATELTLAYVTDISRDDPEVHTSVYGFNRVGKGSDLGRGAFMMQVGANWMFDSTWSVGAFYALEARSHQVNQSVNAALRCCF